MAGDWIKMRMDLPEDPAVFKLAGITGMDRFAVVGRLYAFWSWADHHAVDGRVDGATSQVVDAVTQLNGFSDALVKVKWLEIGDGFIAIPKHERHNGTSAKERALKNQRQERWRRGKAGVDDKVSTKPSTREEKRRGKPPVVPLGFERFWKAWPPHDRKQAKGKCCEVWARLECEPIADAIVSHVEALKASEGWRNGFIPAPLVHLNQRRWEGAEAAPPAEARMVM